MIEKNLKIDLLINQQAHIPYLAQLYYEQLISLWVPNASIQSATERLYQHLNQNILPQAFVALLEGKAIGMACLRVSDGCITEVSSSAVAEATPWLGGLVVDPAYRKQKVGELLIEAVKKNTRILGYDQLHLLAFDKTLPDWYQKLGWNYIGSGILLDHPISIMKISLLK